MLAQADTPEPLELLLIEFRGMRRAVERQNALLEEQSERLLALESENRALREQMKALGPPEEEEPPRRPWWKVWGQ